MNRHQKPGQTTGLTRRNTASFTNESDPAHTSETASGAAQALSGAGTLVRTMAKGANAPEALYDALQAIPQKQGAALAPRIRGSRLRIRRPPTGQRPHTTAGRAFVAIFRCALGGNAELYFRELLGINTRKFPGC